EIFACKIESQHLHENEGKTDFRQGYVGLKYSKYELDERNKNRCKAYLTSLKLNFGCFDFVVDKNGTIYFLECNPNGQWLWIEEETGLPIANAIANTLINARN
ncbi:MAG: hypothetical protein IT239_04345, partial [Bacteroidia bacterium]|nr:hypothetical protein [Bacteroidia bacterium]